MWTITRLLANLFQTKSMEVYEWAEADVKAKRLPNGPQWSTLTTQLPSMHLSMWSLAHAVVKADFADPRNLLMPGLGFLLQADRIIDFSHGPDLRLAGGGATALNDFSATSLAGRLGQGIALLYADYLGYVVSGPLRAHLISTGRIPATGTSSAAADFLFQDHRGEWMVRV